MLIIAPHRNVAAYTQTHFDANTPSVMTGLIDISQFATALVRSSTRNPNVTWNDDMSRVAFQGNTLDLVKARAGVQSMLADVKALLDSLTEHGKRPDVDLTNVQDSMPDRRPGVSYLDSVPESVNERPLLKTLNPAFQPAQLNADGQIVTNRNRAYKLLALDGEITELFAVMLHMLTGAVNRGSEFVATRVRNGLSRTRNIYKQHGETWVVTNYHKGTNITYHDKFVPALVPKQIADELDSYLVHVRPIIVDTVRRIYDEDTALVYKEHLYVREGQRMTSEYFYELVKRMTLKYFGVELSVNMLRHILIAITREYIPTEYHRLNFDGDTVADLMAAHGAEVAISHYAISDSLLPEQTEETMKQSLDFCRAFHNIFGIGIGHVPVPRRVLLRAQQSMAAHLADGATHPAQLTAADLMAHFTPVVHHLFATGFTSIEQRLSGVVEQHVARGLAVAALNGMSMPMSATYPQRRNAAHPEARSAWSFGPGSSATAVSASSSFTSSTHSSPSALSSSTASKRTFDSIDGGPPKKKTSGSERLIHARPGGSSLSSSLSASRHVASASRPSCVQAVDGLPVARDSVGAAQEKQALCDLRAMRGDPQATFKSPEQLDMIVSSRTPESFAVVLATGGGKSLLWELNAHSVDRNNMQLIVLPYKVLQSQALANAQKLGIRAVVYHAGVNDYAPLIFAPIESCLKWEELTRSVRMLRFCTKRADPHHVKRRYFERAPTTFGKLVRIIFDEAQDALLNKDQPFRKGWKESGLLAAAGVSRILASGSIAMRSEQEFLTSNNMRAQTRVIRQSTVRPLISYQIVKVESFYDDALDRCARIVANIRLNHWVEGGRAIVYAGTINRARDLRSSIRALTGQFPSIYVAEDRAPFDDYVREEHFKSWKDGKTDIMVATTAFMMGVDHDRVIAVGFLGMPQQGLIQKVQGDGRGSRGGYPSVAFLVTGDDEPRPAPHAADHACVSELYHLVDMQTGCRRQYTSAVMDAVALSCCEIPGAQRCDLCDPHSAYARLMRPPALLSPPARADDDDMDADMGLDDAMAAIPDAVLTQQALVPTATAAHPDPLLVAVPPPVTHDLNAMFHLSNQVSAQQTLAVQAARTEFAKVMSRRLHAIQGHCHRCWTISGELVRLKPQAPVANFTNYCARGVGCKGTPWPAKDFEWKKKARSVAPNYTICYFCWVPQNVGVHVHDTAGYGKPCAWQDLLHSVAWGVYHKTALRDQIFRMLGFDVAVDLTQYTTLLLTPSPHDPKFCGAAALFDAVWRYHEGRARGSPA